MTDHLDVFRGKRPDYRFEILVAAVQTTVKRMQIAFVILS